MFKIERCFWGSKNEFRQQVWALPLPCSPENFKKTWSGHSTLLVSLSIAKRGTGQMSLKQKGKYTYFVYVPPFRIKESKSVPSGHEALLDVAKFESIQREHVFLLPFLKHSPIKHEYLRPNHANLLVMSLPLRPWTMKYSRKWGQTSSPCFLPSLYRDCGCTCILSWLLDCPVFGRLSPSFLIDFEHCRQVKNKRYRRLNHHEWSRAVKTLCGFRLAWFARQKLDIIFWTTITPRRGAFDCANNRKRQRRKRQSS